MTNTTEAQRRLKAANPVPAPQSLPEGAWTATAFLEEVHERRRAIADPGAGARPNESRRLKTSTWRGPLLAAAVAVAALLVGAIAFLVTASDPRKEFTSSSPAIEVVEAFLDRYEAGDVEGYESLMDPDAIWDCPECIEGPFFTDSGARVLNRTWSHYGAATGIRREAECEAGERLVTCVVTSLSGLQPGTLLQVDEIEIIVHDGAIVDVLVVRTTNGMLPATDLRGLMVYEDWLDENHPEVFDQLFRFRGDPIVDSPEARDLQRQYVTQFLAETGGAPPVSRECVPGFSFGNPPCAIPAP